jgi:hypothetical protein
MKGSIRLTQHVVRTAALLMCQRPKSSAESWQVLLTRWTGLDFLDVFRLWSLWALLSLEFDFVSLSQ